MQCITTFSVSGVYISADAYVTTGKAVLSKFIPITTLIRLIITSMIGLMMTLLSIKTRRAACVARTVADSEQISLS